MPGRDATPPHFDGSCSASAWNHELQIAAQCVTTHNVEVEILAIARLHRFNGGVSAADVTSIRTSHLGHHLITVALTVSSWRPARRSDGPADRNGPRLCVLHARLESFPSTSYGTDWLVGMLDVVEQPAANTKTTPDRAMLAQHRTRALPRGTVILHHRLTRERA
jgi:hypothetical protein